MELKIKVKYFQLVSVATFSSLAAVSGTALKAAASNLTNPLLNFPGQDFSFVAPSDVNADVGSNLRGLHRPRT